jgi:hypothetical protein
MGPDGRAYLAWPGPCIRLSVAAHGRRFGSSQTISDSSVACSQPAIAVAADGSAVIAWRASLPASEEEDRWAPIRVAIRDPQGHISAAQTLSRADGDAPRIGVGSQGEVIVLWQQRSTRGTVVTAAVGRIGATFGPPIQISAPSQQENVRGSLAIDDHGTAIVAYDQGAAVLARVWKSGQAFAAPTRLTRHGRLGGPLVAADNTITAVLATAVGTQLRDWTLTPDHSAAQRHEPRRARVRRARAAGLGGQPAGRAAHGGGGRASSSQTSASAALPIEQA